MTMHVGTLIIILIKLLKNIQLFTFILCVQTPLKSYTLSSHYSGMRKEKKENKKIEKALRCKTRKICLHASRPRKYFDPIESPTIK